MLCCTTDPAWYPASSCLSQGESAGTAQVRGMELSLMCWNKFSSVIFPVCPFSLPKGISKQQGCSLPQLCSAVRSGFPTASGLQAVLFALWKTEVLQFYTDVSTGCPAWPFAERWSRSTWKEEKHKCFIILGLLHAFQFWFPPAAVPSLILHRSFFAEGKSIRNDC